MKIGDQVRFLSETGGGKVAGFQGKNIVLVEDGDGFQIPTPINEVVVVNTDDYSTSRIVESKLGKPQPSDASALGDDRRSVKAMLHDGTDEMAQEEDDDPSDREIAFQRPVQERKGGNALSAYLAFVPVDIKEVANTRFETYLVNDSNYSFHYTYLVAEGNSWTLRAHGELEPNTKLFIEEFGRDVLNELGKVAVQMIAYKTDKSFILKPLLEAQFRIDPVKFYKLHTFQPNEFFEQPALLYDIVVNDVPAKPLVIDAKLLKQQMFAPNVPDATDESSASDADTYVRRYDQPGKKGDPFATKRRDGDDIVVVDLHAEALLDSMAGMQPIDILNYQLKKFRETLAAHADKKGQKIVFIHGKGEGVLRHAIINDLHYRYKQYVYQDASFREYGYGATQVTIK